MESPQDHVKVPSSQRTTPASVTVPVGTWPQYVPADDINAGYIAKSLLDKFNERISQAEYDSLAQLFVEDGFWRDHLALSWNLHTLKGRDNISSFFKKNCILKRLEIDSSSEWRAPAVRPFSPNEDVRGIQFYLKFTSTNGSGRGFMRLVEDGGEWKIWILITSLEELEGFEEPIGPRRATGVQHGAQSGRKNWLDRRNEATNFDNTEPDVLIIGAGHSGLGVHARLKMLNVPTLIIDSNDSIGDNWRKRYHQLVLHDAVWYDHLPYLPFPDFWPVFTPKDKIADFFESYAKLLELNVWMKTTLESSQWDDSKKLWTVAVKRTLGDGTVETKTLHPKHIVQCTGHSGEKSLPEIDGWSFFRGDFLGHSSDFPGARPESKGKKAVVVGACNSSHDICQDFYEKGYDVTMVQRSTTCVVSSGAILDILSGWIYSEDGPPTEDADLYVWSLPAEVRKAQHLQLTQQQVQRDAALLSGLESAGFKLDRGPDECGLFIKYLQRGGGYYIDVGASQLIIDGKVHVKQGQDVVEIMPHGLRFADGSILQADEIVFATGYKGMRTQARKILGDNLADQVGEFWGWDEDGEIRSLAKRSGHPGFWYHGGNLAICRYFSRLLALQIKARLEGRVKEAA